MIYLGNMGPFVKLDCKLLLCSVLSEQLSSSWSNYADLNYFISYIIDEIRGDKQDTRGTAFVVYEDIYDAKNAVDHLSGFNVCNRYLIVLYYQQTKMQKSFDNNSKRKEIDDMKAKFGIKTDE